MFDKERWEADAHRLFVELAGITTAATPHDGRTDSGLTVESTFDDECPPVAFEVTAIHDCRGRATSAALERVERAWRAAASDDGWLVEVDEHADVVALREPVEHLLRRERELCVRDWDYLDGEEARLARRLGEWGLVEVTRGQHSAALQVLLSGDAAPRLSSAELDEALRANAKKLERCRPRRTVLMVGIAVWQLVDVSEIAVPELPAAVDELWVAHLITGSTSSRYVWRASRGDEAWTAMTAPEWWLAPRASISQ